MDGGLKGDERLMVGMGCVKPLWGFLTGKCIRGFWFDGQEILRKGANG